MTWFQNPFTVDYYGVWVIDDRAHHPTFECKRNTGRGDEIVMAWQEPSGVAPTEVVGPDSIIVQRGRFYNLAAGSNKYLTLQFALDSGSFLDWVPLVLDLTGGTDAAATLTPKQIVTNLNANDKFSSLFTASLIKFDKQNFQDRVVIKQNFPATRMRFFVVNGDAESVLRFNARAGVAELPSYFARHTVFNRNAVGAIAFPDGVNLLIQLDTNDSADQSIITNAVDAKGNLLNYDYSTTQEDWQLVKGLTNTFNFINVVSIGCATPEVDDSLTIREICYPAGARVGDLAKKIVREYAAPAEGNDDPVLLRQFVMPHTLTADDLIEPPAECQPPG